MVTKKVVGTHIWITDPEIIDRISGLGSRLGLPTGNVEGILMRMPSTMTSHASTHDGQAPHIRGETVVGIQKSYDPTEPIVVSVQTLGPLSIQVHGHIVAPRQWNQSGAGASNIRKLFAFLLQKRARWLPRERICDAVWPSESDSGTLADRFYRTITGLRRLFLVAGLTTDQAPVLAHQGLYRLNPDIRWEVDADAVATLVQQSRQLEAVDPEAAAGLCEQVLSRDTGEYMADIPYEDVSPDDAVSANWWEERRDELSVLRREARQRLAAHVIKAGRYAEALDLWHQEFDEPDRDLNALQKLAAVIIPACRVSGNEADRLRILQMLRRALSTEPQELIPELLAVEPSFDNP